MNRANKYHGKQAKRGDVTHGRARVHTRRTTGDTRHPTAATRSRRGAPLPIFPPRQIKNKDNDCPVFLFVPVVRVKVTNRFVSIVYFLYGIRRYLVNTNERTSKRSSFFLFRMDTKPLLSLKPRITAVRPSGKGLVRGMDTSVTVTPSPEGTTAIP